MSGEAWMSVWFYAHDLWLKVRSDLSLADRKKAAEVSKRYLGGQAMPRSELPAAFYGVYRDKPVGHMNGFCFANGFFVVSEKAAGILEQFDLGEGGVHPVDIFEYDRTTPVEGRHFLLGLGAVKDAVLPGESKEIHQPWQGHDIWWPESSTRDDDIALGRQALQGPDLWCDSRFQNAFFLSGALVDALKKARAGRIFDLRRCRVV